jgi:hypothetical protein
MACAMRWHPAVLRASAPPSFIAREKRCMCFHVKSSDQRLFGYQLRSLLPQQRMSAARAANFGNRELIVGDVLALFLFCLYKQIMAIVMSPSFEGWLAPIPFNPLRFEELLGFIITVAGTWVATSMVVGDYQAGPKGMLRPAACMYSL